MKLRDLDYYILKEIAEKNFNNLTHRFFETSEMEFEDSINALKKNGLIQGNIFASNGSIKKQFKFFFLSEKGRSVLSEGAV